MAWTETLKGWALERGCRVTWGSLEDLAAALGLVEYGRNNLAYTEEFGSYLQLYGYLTDAALKEGPRAVGPRRMPLCESCGACLAACPTGAIGGDRLLLRAERCLPYANENPGPWPHWVPRSAHNALLGCLACQRVCPANPELPVDEVGMRFTREETAALLAEGSLGEKRSEAGFRTKLAWLGRPDAEEILARNLRALLDRTP
jgi:epoxyqueuosine reductase